MTEEAVDSIPGGSFGWSLQTTYSRGFTLKAHMDWQLHSSSSVVFDRPSAFGPAIDESHPNFRMRAGWAKLLFLRSIYPKEATKEHWCIYHPERQCTRSVGS